MHIIASPCPSMPRSTLCSHGVGNCTNLLACQWSVLCSKTVHKVVEACLFYVEIERALVCRLNR